ncbi:hypothetical protein J2Y54_000601 [Sphingomonas sp. BE123]|uniref:hypothetical protein n=1 Tax=Sphingomonas sp. BE123 TaxID=2817842 RepID=UPI0028612D4E|nr:hypothetical protein [Sphingomonas sp. BE123]MDR6851108.1 hypothetical protein [Sphingomonas sp. BE123]
MIPNVVSMKATAIAGAVLLALGLAGGWKLHNAFVHQPHLATDRAAELRVVKAAARLTAEAQRLGEARRAQLARRQAEIRTVTNTILKEVPRYVEATVRCPAADPFAGAGKAIDPPRVALADVSVGFGMLHNYAAVGIAPPATPAAGVDLGAPSGVGMPGVAAAIVSNYGQCHAAIAEVASWRAWHRDDFSPWWMRVDAELSKAGRR